MSNKTPIEIGSVVTLKSGGPQMTVEEIRGDIADVQWFDDKRNPRSGAYKIALLDNHADWRPFG